MSKMSKDDMGIGKNKKILNSLKEDDSFFNKNRFLSYSTIVLAISLIAALVSTLNIIISNNKEYVNKARLKATICEVINKGGSLEIVKHAFNSRNVIVKRWELSSSEIEQYYDNEKLTLADVVQDLIVDYYIDEDSLRTPSGLLYYPIYHPKENDSTYLKRLESTLEELQLKNPFDELEIEQRTLFQNVQTKLSDTNYYLIKEDISLISKTLSEKNILTKQYLQKSNTSFWISIIAVLITMIFGIIQLYQSITKKRKDEDVYKKMFEKFDQTK